MGAALRAGIRRIWRWWRRGRHPGPDLGWGVGHSRLKASRRGWSEKGQFKACKPEKQEISIDHALACFLTLPLFAGWRVWTQGWLVRLCLTVFPKTRKFQICQDSPKP